MNLTSSVPPQQVLTCSLTGCPPPPPPCLCVCVLLCIKKNQLCLFVSKMQLPAVLFQTENLSYNITLSHLPLFVISVLQTLLSFCEINNLTVNALHFLYFSSPPLLWFSISHLRTQDISSACDNPTQESTKHSPTYTHSPFLHPQLAFPQFPSQVDTSAAAVN